MPATTRDHLLDWFDAFDPAEHDSKQLLSAYNALTGEGATLVTHRCAHCGAQDCPGAVDVSKCSWTRINDCSRCRQTPCLCDPCRTE